MGPARPLKPRERIGFDAKFSNLKSKKVCSCPFLSKHLMSFEQHISIPREAMAEREIFQTSLKRHFAHLVRRLKSNNCLRFACFIIEDSKGMKPR